MYGKPKWVSNEAEFILGDVRNKEDWKKALENIDAIAQKPFQAYPGQDHRAHISAHLYFMSTNMVRNNPIIMGAMEKNILEHKLKFNEADNRQLAAEIVTEISARLRRLACPSAGRSITDKNPIFR